MFAAVPAEDSRLIPIRDPDDPRIEAFRFVRERDLAGRAGLFVAEGEVVLRILLSRQSRFQPVSVLVAENRLASLSDILPGSAGGAPVFVASSGVLDRIAGFPLHRGILALGSREPVRPAAPIPPSTGPALALGLIGLANHDNVGAAFRNAAAFGCGAVLLDEGSCDPLYRKAIRVSVGAALTVPFRRGGSADALVAELEAAGFALFALSPDGRDGLGALAGPPRRALLMGSEGEGLPPGLLARLRTVRIAMAPGFDSLNVATAAGIALHAAAGLDAPVRDEPPDDGSDRA